MVGALDKYIRRLTEDEIEHHRLTEQQISRRVHAAAEIRDRYSDALLRNGLLRHLYTVCELCFLNGLLR